VVDNCSNDNSRDLAISSYPDINWIQKNKNDGFGRANNIGIKQSTGEYILLLNSDMVVVENTIENCLKKIKSDKNIGALGCKLLNEDGSDQKSTYSIAGYKQMLDINLVFNKFIKLNIGSHESIMGSFMLMPKMVLDVCGSFDPDFFMYSEELDLCNRIKEHGYEIVYYSQAEAIHKHGGSTSDKTWAIKQRYLSNALLYYKVRGIGGYLLYHFLFIVNTFSNFAVMWFLDKGYRDDYFMTQRGYFSNFFIYLAIPLLYKRKIGDGKRLLRRS
jgi:GT2 family glycosyltransferase